MNILLIYPEFPDTFWSFKHALKFINKRASTPPLGPITVAALLPKEWTLKLVDMNVTKLTRKDIEWADYAFISGMIIQRNSILEIIEICKKADLPIVAGGPLFTVAHDHPDFEWIQHFVLDEAESSLPPFLEDLKKGRAQRVYRSADYPDIQNSPIPLYKLLDMNKYATMSIQFSRGCPFNCKFCNITSLFGHKVRTKTAEQIIAELEVLYKLGWRKGVFFVDDNLIGNKQRLKHELLPALVKWVRNKDISFNTQASINLADDDELIKLMVKARFTAVFIGLETPDESSLDECNKGQNINRDMIADVKKLQRAGLLIQGGFIVGFENDGPNIFQRQVDFIKSSGITTAMVGLLHAIPGTMLYKELAQKGRLKSTFFGDNTGNETNVIFLMNHEVVMAGYNYILQSIFAPRTYYQTAKTFLREYRMPNIRSSFRVADVVAGIKSFTFLGIMSKGRREYWKFILWTLFKRPKLLPFAMTLAIHGYHFRKIFNVTDVH